MIDIACWISFFADGARRNSSRWDLYSRLCDADFLRVDGVITLLKIMYGNSPYLTRGFLDVAIKVWPRPLFSKAIACRDVGSLGPTANALAPRLGRRGSSDASLRRWLS